MPSAAFFRWQTDRTPRLNEVEAHCVSVMSHVPPNPTFLDETLRGFVLHLSAHFQGFCRELYRECSQIWINAIPIGFQSSAQAQFFAHLALEKGNPSYDNIKRDFNRFGISLDLQATHPTGAQRVTALGHLNEWRNKAAHQGTQPLGSGITSTLTLPILAGVETILRRIGDFDGRNNGCRASPHYGSCSLVRGNTNDRTESD